MSLPVTSRASTVPDTGCPANMNRLPPWCLLGARGTFSVLQPPAQRSPSVSRVAPAAVLPRPRGPSAPVWAAGLLSPGRTEWALQDSNPRPQPCESVLGGFRHLGIPGKTQLRGHLRLPLLRVGTPSFPLVRARSAHEIGVLVA